MTIFWIKQAFFKDLVVNILLKKAINMFERTETGEYIYKDVV